MRYLEHGLREGPHFLSHTLEQPPQAAVYQDMYMDNPIELHFEGDSVRSGPNVMWLWVTGNRMEFSYFFWENEPIREWGYVFWDQKRLEKWNVPNEKYTTWAERSRAHIRSLHKYSAKEA